jgi:hypothetical protein
LKAANVGCTAGLATATGLPAGDAPTATGDAAGLGAETAAGEAAAGGDEAAAGLLAAEVAADEGGAAGDPHPARITRPARQMGRTTAEPGD